MNAHVDHLLQEVLRLTAEERSAVAASLIDSLESADEVEVRETWRVDLLRRRAALRAGAVATRPWAEVRSRMAAR